MQRLNSRTRLRRPRSSAGRYGIRRAATIQPLENRKLLAGDIYGVEAISSDQPALVSTYQPTARIVNGQTTDDFAAVGVVNQGCTGTLITPMHVLTAAHCTVGTPASQMSFDVGGQTYQVSQETTHPEYDDNAFDRGFDLAIMTLDRAVVGIEPHQILRTAPQLGQMLTLVGFGEGGTSDTGSLFDFGTKRVGETPIDEITRNHISWNFDAGESNTAPGDSGGPAFVQVDGEYVIAGVTSGGDGDSHRVGDYSFDTRIDTLADWIDSVTNSTGPVDPPDDDGGDGSGGDGDGSGGDGSNVGDDHADVIGADATVIEIDAGLGLADGVLEETGDRDVFTFTIDTEGQYDVVLYGQDADIDTALSITDADGQVIASVAEVGSLADSLITIDLTAGDYYVVAEASGEVDTGAYFLDIVSAESGNDFALNDQPVDEQGLDDQWGDEGVAGDEFDQGAWDDEEGLNDVDLGGDEFGDEGWWDLPFDESLDCNQDRRLSASDALVVLNDLGNFGARTVTDSQFDANRDNRVSAIDALMIINSLNQMSAMQASVPIAVAGNAHDHAFTSEDDWSMPSLF